MNKNITVKELLKMIEKDVEEIIENTNRENAKESGRMVRALGFLEGSLKGYLLDK